MVVAFVSMMDSMITMPAEFITGDRDRFLCDVHPNEFARFIASLLS